ncbi:MAG: SRPBCC domain-containing protein [Actinomycetota bacterium]
MTRFEASTHIDAPPEVVWDRLMQTERWTEWDAALERVDGSLAEGGKVTIHVVDQSRPFPLKVKDWQPPRRLALRGGMPLGLFAGVRTYDLQVREGGTSFRMVEEYSGLLAPLITRSIPDLQPSFDAFVGGLRAAAESV